MLGLSNTALQNIIFTGKVYSPENIEKAQSDAKVAKMWEKAAIAWIPGLVISAWSVVCLPLAFMAGLSGAPGEPSSFIKCIFVSASLSPIILFTEMVLIVIATPLPISLAR